MSRGNSKEDTQMITTQDDVELAVEMLEEAGLKIEVLEKTKPSDL